MSLESQETIFHKIVKREIPADIVYEDTEILAFKDIRPVSPTHILIIPKNRNIPTLRDVNEEDKNLLGQMVIAASEIARKQGISESGYRLVINCGDNSGQEVYQLHMHLLGGRKFTWPPG
jgi:histidine triad (HIT) family protein